MCLGCQSECVFVIGCIKDEFYNGFGNGQDGIVCLVCSNMCLCYFEFGLLIS